MGEIFSFFLHLIFEHFHASKELREQGQEAELNVHVRVVQVVLLTLTGFIEWVSINHIMASDGQLLQILCLLLDDENFQAGAAECLLQVVTYPFSSISGTSNVMLPFLHRMAP
jgi:exportin-5